MTNVSLSQGIFSLEENIKFTLLVFKDPEAGPQCNKVSAKNLLCTLDNGEKSQRANLYDTLKKIFNNAKNEKLRHFKDPSKKEQLSKQLADSYEAKLNKYTQIDTTDGQGLLHCSAWASEHGGFSCGAQALGA